MGALFCENSKIETPNLNQEKSGHRKTSLTENQTLG